MAAHSFTLLLLLLLLLACWLAVCRFVCLILPFYQLLLLLPLLLQPACTCICQPSSCLECLLCCC
jgi:hypothetical protein